MWRKEGLGWFWSHTQTVLRDCLVVLRGPFGVLGIKPWSTVCKASALLLFPPAMALAHGAEILVLALVLVSKGLPVWGTFISDEANGPALLAGMYAGTVCRPRAPAWPYACPRGPKPFVVSCSWSQRGLWAPWSGRFKGCCLKSQWSELGQREEAENGVLPGDLGEGHWTLDFEG